jgi:hypothetical protein
MELGRQLVPGKDAHEHRPRFLTRFAPDKERQERRHSFVPHKGAKKVRQRNN